MSDPTIQSAQQLTMALKEQQVDRFEEATGMTPAQAVDLQREEAITALVSEVDPDAGEKIEEMIKEEVSGEDADLGLSQQQELKDELEPELEQVPDSVMETLPPQEEEANGAPSKPAAPPAPEVRVDPRIQQLEAITQQIRNGSLIERDPDSPDFGKLKESALELIERGFEIVGELPESFLDQGKIFAAIVAKELFVEGAVHDLGQAAKIITLLEGYQDLGFDELNAALKEIKQIAAEARFKATLVILELHELQLKDIEDREEKELKRNEQLKEADLALREEQELITFRPPYSPDQLAPHFSVTEAVGGPLTTSRLDNVAELPSPLGEAATQTSSSGMVDSELFTENGAEFVF